MNVSKFSYMNLELGVKLGIKEALINQGKVLFLRKGLKEGSIANNTYWIILD